VEGKENFFRKKMNLLILINIRYRQEAYMHEEKIYLFGGGGSSGVSFSLENVSVRKYR